MCGVIDSFFNFINRITVQCGVRVSCMIISFYFRLGLPALALDLDSLKRWRCVVTGTYNTHTAYKVQYCAFGVHAVT